jgi:membrane protein
MMVRRKITPWAKKRTWALWDLLAETYNEWSKDNAMTLGAALAFYTTFSLAPLLLVVMVVAGFVVGSAQVQAEIMQRLQETVGAGGAQAVKTMIHKAFRPASGLTATIIGVVVLLYGATRSFLMLRQALNIMWGVKPSPNVEIKNYLIGQLLSFAMVLGVGFLLVLFFLLTTGLSAAGHFLSDLLPIPVFFFQLGNFIISIFLITLLIALIFKVLPDVEIAWGDVWVGAAITAVLFTLGNIALGWYLARSSISSAYGAASSLAVLLFWVYYSAQILFVGAEFTQVYANKYGSRVQPRGRGQNRPGGAAEVGG